ncbi:FxLD family lanthipeptide [Dactylosporangium sp. NPDC005572]|uniref:FxLD family lanthipeptide n=1 Tax=Dactylosporangium sp. NPDC005572 TaxID=3156889 RepID=UPI0033A9064E
MAPQPSAPHTPAVTDPGDGFDLDVTIVELTDPGSMINVTNDGCGSTCGACVTGAP